MTRPARRAFALLAGALLLPGCCGAQPASVPAPVAATARVFKSIGSVQCEGGGTPLPQLAQQLADAGIAIVASDCGSDGRMRAQVCGGADGRIAIFEIAADAAPAAEQLGYAALARLPDARTVPCH